MDKLNEISQAIGILQGTVNGINDRLDRINGRLDSHNEKINSLETFKDQTIGKTAVLGTIFGFIGAIIISLFGFFLKSK